MGTHKLETSEGGTSQDTERKQPIQGHLLPGDHRKRDKSEYRKNTTKPGHSLPGDHRGGASQDTERK